MNKLKKLIFIFALAALPAMAQTSTPFSIELGADAYNATSVPNGSLGVLLGDKTRVGPVIDLKPTNVLGQLTYAVRAVAEQTVYRSSNVEFFLMGGGGLAVSDIAKSGIITGGGGISFISSKLKGWRPTVTAEALAAPADGSAPRLALGVWLRRGFNQ